MLKNKLSLGITWPHLRKNSVSYARGFSHHINVIVHVSINDDKSSVAFSLAPFILAGAISLPSGEYLAIFDVITKDASSLPCPCGY